MFDRTALAVAIQAGAPTIIWGPPGTGKTAYTKWLAAFLKRRLVTLMASVREPQDFAGMPYMDHENKQVIFNPPSWAKGMKSGDILFLEEASTAPPAVQAPMLRLVHEHTVGDDFKLPEDIAIIAAANPPEQAAGGWDLAPPLANRFFHIDWSFTPIEWVRGYLADWPSIDVPVLPADWKKHIPQSKSLVASFISKRPSLALDLPKEESKASRAWASPRSWQMAGELHAAGTACKVAPEVMNLLIAGCVGEGAATEFISWTQELDLPDPEVLLANPKELKLPSRGDRAYAVLAGVISAVASKNTPARWEAAALIVALSGKEKQDVAAHALASLATIRPPKSNAPPELAYLLKILNTIKG